MQVVTGEEMGRIDRFTIEEIGLKEEVLMESAGRAAANKIMESISPSDNVGILIGTGNNGGDGFVIARCLLDAGFKVDVWLIPPESKVKGAALYHLNVFKNSGYTFADYSSFKSDEKEVPGQWDVIVDTLLGTGVQGSLREPYHAIVQSINQSSCKVISVDIPSGVPASKGEVEGEAVKASVTFILQSPKLSAFLAPADEYYGKRECVDIGLPMRAYHAVKPDRYLWSREQVSASFPARNKHTHKGSYGKGLLAGGSIHMTGAPVLAATSALRSGAGLLTTAVPEEALSTVASQVAESTFLPLPSKEGEVSEEVGTLDLSLSNYDGVAAGPGLGRNEGTRTLVQKLLNEVKGPLVLDADALFVLKELGEEWRKRDFPLILTPHPGELAHLTGLSPAEVNRQRFSISRSFAAQHGCYLILKGPHTIVTTPEGRQYVNDSGNPSLAKGGTGDVLTGMILSFVMSHSAIQEALSNAVFLHGKAADMLVDDVSSPIL
ncbi:bifunctional ADP-dependent NAD(P)H-hydrate dehydratase/NAD(P)H-hydrate epimerase [Thalassobacillus sp. C254]|uniref:bifunctional ADP-dependent NAD(P)H-hydrate dehydratase/NAD(P)H-hydrate epimerase n=1 Tax=Thalassobacillus sp. C254 TaxID=1225341 RepID=UPI0006CF76E5|nr:bifunctional ADP-dependent NAD(P)H-hydrate dehydratase/NAD(P)H-hydrate epimerase [Thalassobacillus sp. C254]